MTTAIAPQSKASAGPLSSRSASSRTAPDFGAALEQRVDRSARNGPASRPPESADQPPKPKSPSADQPEDAVEPTAEGSAKTAVSRKPDPAETDDVPPTESQPQAAAAPEESTAPTLGLEAPAAESGDTDSPETDPLAIDGPAKPVEAEGTGLSLATGVMQVTPSTSTPLEPTTEPTSVGPQGSGPKVVGTATDATATESSPADVAGGEGGFGVKTEAGSARSAGKPQAAELPPVAQPAGDVASEQQAAPASPAGKLDFLSTLHSLTQPAVTPETGRTAQASELAAPATVAAPSYSPEVRFAEANTANIVQGVRQQLLPNGGTMTLRLDPPEVGALQVSVMMKDGLASVSFVTDNPEAARMMTNTLTQLRDALSTSGLTVDRLTVSQTPRSEGSSQSNTGSQQQQGQGDPRGQGFGFQDDARRDQQRRDLLERMWRKVTGDDINLVA